MSKDKTDATENKNKSPLGIILLVFALLAVLLGAGLYKNAQKNKDDTAQATMVVEDTTPSEEVTAETIAPIETIEELDATVNLDIEALSKPRTLGNPNAPVRITEHSSFTCPHCAQFHKDNFKKLKTEYVDTGKAYIVFDDFPLNKFDIHVGAVARCVPDDAYFNFIQLMFETQRDWLDDNYVSYLAQNAKLAGVSQEKIEACLKSEELHKALSDHRQVAMDEHNVTGTPSIVINGTNTMSGLAPYADIKAAIDSELAKTGE